MKKIILFVTFVVVILALVSLASAHKPKPAAKPSKVKLTKKQEEFLSDFISFLMRRPRTGQTVEDTSYRGKLRVPQGRHRRRPIFDEEFKKQLRALENPKHPHD